MRIFSGIQPTGRKHLGNYIGAITQYVAGQDRGEAIYCIVDLHATTVPYEPAELRERVYDTAPILLAAGLDPDRCILFRQADPPDHRIPPVGARIMDLQAPERKMATTGGSEQGTVFVLDEPELLERKVRSAVTDSGTEVVRGPDKPGISNLIEILAAVRGTDPAE